MKGVAKMIKTCGSNDYAKVLQDKMAKGVFLTTAFNETINTMVIGWGGINVVWGKPMMMILVRNNRATYEIIEKANEFTISVPINHDMMDALKICGTKSMREINNKFSYCHLTPVSGRTIKTPVVGECELHYECKILYRQQLNQDQIPDIIKKRYYPTNNYHTLYFGEIVDTYLFEDGE